MKKGSLDDVHDEKEEEDESKDEDGDEEGEDDKDTDDEESLGVRVARMMKIHMRLKVSRTKVKMKKLSLN